MKKSEYQVVALINTVGGQVNVYDEDAFGSGVVSNKGESYLCLQWANPGSEIAGSYVCEANGRSLSWRPQTYTVIAEITSSVISQNSILEQLKTSRLENNVRINEINNLTERISALENNVTMSTNLINKLKDENKVALKTLFFESSVYNGRRYYLSKESAIVTYTSSQVTCAKYGGYLAEIDDEAEFNSVREFLRNHSSYSVVLISGCDEEHENYWTHARSNTPLKYLKWYYQDPNGGRSDNCLCLWKDADWYFSDLKCVVFDTSPYFSFLCEFEDI